MRFKNNYQKMGIVNDKRDILKDIGVFTSLGETVSLDQTDSLSSINNSNEIVPFLLDILTVTAGSNAIKNSLGEIVTDFSRKSEDQLKSSIEEQSKMRNDVMTDEFKTNGYTIPVKHIDPKGKLKTDPNSQTGSLLYSQNANDFDNKAYSAIASPGTDVTFGTVTMRYEEGSDSINVKPSNTSSTVTALISGFIGGMILINEKEFITIILDAIFGTVSKEQNKTQEEIKNDEIINLVVDKLIKEEELIISDDENIKINNIALNKQKGQNKVDIGCGILTVSTTLEEIETLTTNVLNSNDPLFIGQQFDTLFTNSFNPNDEGLATDNDQTIKDGFFKRIIFAINSYLLGTLLMTPQTRMLQGIVNGQKNNNDLGLSNDILADTNANKNIAKCISDSSKELINEFIYDLVKREILDIIANASKIIIKEKITAFLSILKSLI